MLTACTHKDVKNYIIDAFQDPSSHIQVIIATVAFGMGLDCPDVRIIIHWAPPDDVESYFKRLGEQVEMAILLQQSCATMPKTLQEHMLHSK